MISASYDGFDALVPAREAAWRLGGIPRGGGPVGAKRRRRAHRKIAAYVARERRWAERRLSALRSFKLASFERIVARMLARIEDLRRIAWVAWDEETTRHNYGAIDSALGDICYARDIARDAANEDGPWAWSQTNRGARLLLARRHLAMARMQMRQVVSWQEIQDAKDALAARAVMS